jgi:hypothetical protein
MSLANPLWGAPRIHGEPLKLGIAVAQSTVARYLPRFRKLPSQAWRTFLTNRRPQELRTLEAGMPLNLYNNLLHANRTDSSTGLFCFLARCSLFAV